MDSIRFEVYSDYLCPWCFNATVRLRRLKAEYGDRIEIVWRSFLLRPAPGLQRDLERFRAYTRSWLRPAAEPLAGEFRVWEGDAGPPSHSVPPHLAAKAAAALGAEAFERLHMRLLRAYFTENRDVTSRDTLVELWGEVDLPAREFDRTTDPALLKRTRAEHAQAIETGVSGVPAMRVEGRDAIIVGAQPLEVYRRWVDRLLAC